MVGAVIVREGRVIGLGHHRRFGEAHAEVEAIASAARQGKHVHGATMYVTLEPCNHTGKQPPCVEAILESGIAHVVYAREDPGERSGGGAERLRAEGVLAELCGASDRAVRVSDSFMRCQGSEANAGRPWVIAKWAQTIDGRIATRSGESKWISGEGSRRRVHRLRGQVDAILTGLGTVLADDPTLTARDARVRRTATRVVVDAGLDIPLESRLVRSATESSVIIACDESIAKTPLSSDKREALRAAGVTLLGVPEGDRRGTPRGVDLELMLQGLLSRGISTVLVEAGTGLVGSLIERDLVDELRVYVAPLLLGDELARSAAGGLVVDSLSSGRRFRLCRVKRIGEDVELSYCV